MHWTNFTSVDDPDNKWTGDANAIDGACDTYATCLNADFNHWLEAFPASPVLCDKVRFANGTAVVVTDVEIKYGENWHRVYIDIPDPSGGPLCGGREKEITLSPPVTLQGMRIKGIPRFSYDLQVRIMQFNIEPFQYFLASV